MIVHIPPSILMNLWRHRFLPRVFPQWLGGSTHPVHFEIPKGISIETPSQTEIVISGVDKQQVGQVAADIRSVRPPEPYKGKGIKYSDEEIVKKEAKKK